MNQPSYAPEDRAMEHNGVFSGPRAIRELLDPARNPPAPLVELPEEMNPFSGERVHIFAKLMYLLPLLNIKSLPALNMLIEAEAAGKLEGVDTIVENSSGNTAFSLGILAPLVGVRRVKAIVPWDIAPGKLESLRLAGVEPILKREAPGEPTGIQMARAMGKQKGYFSPGQYENEANPRAGERWLGPQIWEQTGGKLTVFAAGLGTAGTMLGAARYFKKKGGRVTSVGVICAPNAAVPGVRSEARLRESGFDWRGGIDHVLEEETKISFKKSLELCRHGLIAGPSSGFALAGLLRFLESRRKALDGMRNADGDVYAVFVCPDTPFPYLDKYSTHLDPSDF